VHASSSQYLFQSIPFLPPARRRDPSAVKAPLAHWINTLCAQNRNSLTSFQAHGISK
jgi:hypothetical protein